jgi:hypothetical protein
MASAVAIALSIACVGAFTMRPGQRNRLWEWALGATLILLTWGAWFAYRFFADWYIGARFPIASDLSDRMQSIILSRYLKTANLRTISFICHALIAWTFFAVLGYRLQRTLPDHPSVGSKQFGRNDRVQPHVGESL